MSFLIYFAVLLFAGASALFGLDVLTAPLPVKHHPRPPIADNATPSKSDRSKVGRAVAEREEGDKTKTGRPMSPVYPTSPGIAKSEVREVYPPSNPELSAVVAQQNQDKQAASPAPQQQAPQQQVAATQPAANPPRAETNGSASAEPAQSAQPAQQASVPNVAGQPATQAAAQPVAQQTSNKCNVQACASVYQSFSAADCTYQPFDGPRRLCTKGEGQQRVASQPRQEQQSSRREQSSREDYFRQDRPQRAERQDADRDSGLRDAVRRVKSLRDWTNDDTDYDAPVMAGRGRRVIVVPDDADGDWR